MAKAKLATSVVMTFSLVGPGCEGGERSVNPPPPPEEPSVNPPAPAPEPEPPPEPAPRRGEVSYEARSDGSCWMYVSPNCPPNTACNPPPPQKVECTNEMFPEASDPKRVDLRSDGSCWERISVECEPGASCNPPPPHRVRCVEKPNPVKQAK